MRQDRLGVRAWLGEFVEALRRHQIPRLGAALAYYTFFSLSPLLVVVVAIAGLVFGRAAAEGRLVSEIEGLVGHDGAVAIQSLLEHARRPGSGILATILVWVYYSAQILFLGAEIAQLRTHHRVTARPG